MLSNYFFGFWVNKLVLQDKKYPSWQTSLLCIVMELAEGGSLFVAKDVAVAVGFIGFVLLSTLRDSVALQFIFFFSFYSTKNVLLIFF